MSESESDDDEDFDEDDDEEEESDYEDGKSYILEDLSEEGLSWDELEEKTKKCLLFNFRGNVKSHGKNLVKKKMIFILDYTCISILYLYHIPNKKIIIINFFRFNSIS